MLLAVTAEASRPRFTPVVASAAFGLLVALGEFAVFDAAGRLQGPTLFGESVVVESILIATFGAAFGVIASFRRAAP